MEIVRHFDFRNGSKKPLHFFTKLLRNEQHKTDQKAEEKNKQKQK